MICQATYDSVDEIPDAFKDEFESKKGKWVLKESAVPGAGPLFNPGLAENAEKSLKQVKIRNERITALETEVTRLQDKVDGLNVGDSEIFSKKDAETFKELTALGTPKEIKARLDEQVELKDKVTKFETESSLTAVVTSLDEIGIKLNKDVLVDWLSSPEAEGVNIVLKETEVIDAKGVKTKTVVPYASVEQEVRGKIQVTERELLPFAEESLPAWKYQALTAGTSEDNKQTPVKGVRLPDLQSAERKPKAEEKKRPVDIFNEQRANKPNPFTKQGQSPVAPGTLPIVR